MGTIRRTSTVRYAGSEVASAISTLAGNDGTGAINGGSVTTLTGSVTEINAALQRWVLIRRTSTVR